MKTDRTEYTIYFAGPLFDHKDLIGNALMAEAITEMSDGKYRCILPQDLEQFTDRAVDIRNQDLIHVMQCDLSIFNFDGTELDSGTVVEFMYAKTLDIPALIIRSDFRGSGDQKKDGDQWNLMASFYPRTRVLNFHAMEWYQATQSDLSNDHDVFDIASIFYKRVARQVIRELDAVMLDPPLLSYENGQAYETYCWAMKFPGGALSEMKMTSEIKEIILSKKSKGLLS